MLKVAITLRLLLNYNKSYIDVNTEKDDSVNSYEKIAANSSADIRKATVTNAFSGAKKSTMVTIMLIVESMGFNMRDFGDQYDKITEKDIKEFKEFINKNKS
ncbi:hypothetical protein [Chryseobacterium sp. JAH]|uniref:hypothetical protein n=1 Tax=Chryseobacterium sp. JAH TaxID=1742858 RepID=UPI0010417CC3|nr:hypothetical protein [Chryseobacterium sp. JAH]